MVDKADQILNKLDKLTGLYDGLKQEFTLLNGAVSRIENEKLPVIDKEIKQVRKELKETRDDLKGEIKSIKEKLDEHVKQPAHF